MPSQKRNGRKLREPKAGGPIGDIVEKIILGGKQSEGRVPFSETPEGKKRKWRMAHKGLAARWEV